MSIRTRPPFRADHVGSLLRPPALLRARGEHAGGRISAEELRVVEDAAVREVVAMQEAIGLRSATDGELRRASWHMDFIYQIEGVRAAHDVNLRSVFRNERGTIEFTPAKAMISGRLGIDHTIFGTDFEFLRSAVTTATPKLTIPSPSMVHYRGGPTAIDSAIYPEMELFWRDLGAAYREELRRLAELGCTYLQLDDTCFAYLNDPRQREEIARRGEDAERLHLTYISTINRALEGRPDGMTVTTHTCRGNFRSSWVAEGGYDHVAEALFNELNVDGYFMEFDDERSGGFECLRFVPRDKVVVLGLVTTKRGELETRDQLKRRIEEATRHIDVDQLCLSPQCGFASTVDGNDLTVEQEAAKLRLVVETADEVWGAHALA